MTIIPYDDYFYYFEKMHDANGKIPDVFHLAFNNLMSLMLNMI